MELLRSERLDDVVGEGLKIIQSDEVFSFSLDAVLLANFVNVPIQKGAIIDLCTGNAIIPLILTKRSKAHITGVELQERLFHMGERSVRYNELEESITLYNEDLRTFDRNLGKFDVATCNPPYFQVSEQNLKNENEHFTIARHEVHCTLDDCIARMSKLVKFGGKVALVHRSERFVDILCTMRKYQIEPKRVQFVYPKQGREANTVLVEGIRNGKSGTKFLAPLFVYNEDGKYTKEVAKMVNGER
ncbi:MAG: tRNA1(Val) (adenine(37)-N6)-methyltransferase [Bacilli bacterium]